MLVRPAKIIRAVTIPPCVPSNDRRLLSFGLVCYTAEVNRRGQALVKPVLPGLASFRQNTSFKYRTLTGLTHGPTGDQSKRAKTFLPVIYV